MFRAKLTVFVFSGITAGVGGALFASLQSYITPDTFHNCCLAFSCVLNDILCIIKMIQLHNAV